jgi:hypothetical protein
MPVFHSVREIATAVFTFLALAIITNFIGVNIRTFAQKRSLDTYLDRWAEHPRIANAAGVLVGWCRRMIAGWQPLRRRWWLWLALGLSGGLTISLWMMPYFEIQSAAIGQITSDYSLAKAVEAFLAKQNKAPRWGQTADGRATVGLGSGTGLTDDQFITFWDASLGKWPSIQDGFTPLQLRIFPPKIPTFTTQYDKENFRSAVDALQKLMNQKIGAIVRLSQSLGPIGLTRENEGEFQGAVAGLVGIGCGVVSGVINLESSGVEASDWRPRHDEHYHEA